MTNINRGIYYFPSYTKVKYSDSSLIVYSELFKSELLIYDSEVKSQFIKIFKDKQVHGINSELEMNLNKLGLIQSYSEIVESLNEVKSLFNKRLFFTIMPTEECNFACQYCYELRKHEKMNKNTLNHILSYIEKRVCDINNIVISWFGGEPTLCKETIVDFSKRLLHLIQSYNIVYTSSMTTNGYLLDVESFKDYYNCGIRDYQITLDGFDHDKTRFLLSGKGTLDTILNNLREISNLSKEYLFTIRLRKNIVGEERDFQWYDYLKNHFGDDDRFSVIVASVCDWGGEGVKKLQVLDKDRKIQLKKDHNNYIDSIGLKRVGMEKKPYSDICYSSFESGFVFRSNGKIQKCTVYLDNPLNTVGYVDEKEGVIVYENLNRKWHVSSLNKKCITCNELLSCINMCCRKKIVLDGQNEDQCVCDLL